MKNEELIINSVGAGPVFAQKYRNKLNANDVGACIARPKENKNTANNVGAESISTQIKSSNAITLIALIITIIIMLILVGITLNLTLGEHGIFTTAKNASDEYSKQEAREKLELVLLDMQSEKVTNTEYNENEYLTKKIEENNMKVDGNTVTVGKWKFEIDRSVPKIAGNTEEEDKEIVKTGLIAWYDGIDNTESGHSYDVATWKDLSGNNAQGATINGATWTKDGLYFDGSNDWVNMNSILMPEENDFTIDIVMYQSVYHDNAFVLAQNSSGTSEGRTGLNISSGGISVDTYYFNNDYIQVDSKYKPKLTEKVNVSIVRNGNKFEIWINGEKKKEEILEKETKIYQNDTALGKWGLNNYGYFNGVIYSIKAYDKALNNQEIMKNYKVNNNRFNIEDKIGNREIVKTGLTAWYDGIDNTESGHSYDVAAWKDLSGNNEQGATINGATWTSNGLYFDGDDWVNMNSILMPEEENFTIDIVFSQNSIISNYVFAQSNSNANGRTGIAEADSNNGIQFHSLSSKDYMVLESEYIPKLTERVNVSIVRNGNKFELWINGEKKVEQENTYGKVLQANTILGKWGLENKYYYYGIIYSVKAYNRALNSNEITQNYTANKLRFNM